MDEIEPAFPAAPAAYARRHSLADLLHRTARREPDRTAVVYRELRQTYAELDAVVSRTAGALAARGVAAGDRIAIFSHNNHAFVVCYFALARLGAVSVPINFMLGPDEVGYVLEHAEATGLIAEDALVPVAGRTPGVAGLAIRAVIMDHGGDVPAGWEPVTDWMAFEGPAAPDVVIGDDDLAQLIYTSGTESRPKGAMLTHRSLIAQYVSCIVDGGMSPDDVELHTLPMYHCAQLDCFFSVDVYLGATSVILPGPDPAAMLAAIQREQVTKLFCPPTVWISLLRHPGFDDADLSSLRKGYYGASPMPVEVLRELQRRLPDVQLWNFYGQTEMAPLATILRPHEQLERAGSAGKASLNVETLLVDDDGQPVPAGEVGEIVHRSPHAALGYYRDEIKTAEAFSGGWFHSGDLGVMTEDGYLSVVDRKKDMIKTGGENVASREVEEAIYELDGVAEVAVFGIAHPHWIEAVTAVVVPRDGSGLTADDVRAHARTRLAGYKRPKYVVFSDGLPKNPSGKILKRDLRQQHAGLAQDAPD